MFFHLRNRNTDQYNIALALKEIILYGWLKLKLTIRIFHVNMKVISIKWLDWTDPENHLSNSNTQKCHLKYNKYTLDIQLSSKYKQGKKSPNRGKLTLEGEWKLMPRVSWALLLARALDSTIVSEGDSLCWELEMNCCIKPRFIRSDPFIKLKLYELLKPRKNGSKSYSLPEIVGRKRDPEGTIISGFLPFSEVRVRNPQSTPQSSSMKRSIRVDYSWNDILATQEK